MSNNANTRLYYMTHNHDHAWIKAVITQAPTLFDSEIGTEIELCAFCYVVKDT